MAQKWSGDGTSYLPARQVEPYRLWFEFLKLAHMDPDIRVDYDFYADWGPFWEMPFNEWWSGETWRKLFAVDTEMRVLDGGETVPIDEQALHIRLPLGKDPKETLRDIQQLLEQHDAGIQFATGIRGKYALSEGYERAFLKYLDRANLMLRLYRIWLGNADYDRKTQIRKTAYDFYDWATTRDAMIVERNYRYTRPLLPFSLKKYVESLEQGHNMTNSDEHRQFTRYLKKAHNLAKNAGSGVFPGKY